MHSLVLVRNLLKKRSVTLVYFLNDAKTFSVFNMSKMLNIRPNCKIFYRLCSSKKEIKTDVQQLLDNAALFENDPGSEKLWSTSPYPKDVYNPRLQSNYALRPRVDPRETSIILFPGEGSQYVGMGKNLLKYPTVRDIFACANDILKYNLLALCMKGPKSKLDETKHAQVAVLVCSFAALERMKEERVSGVNNCIATGGFGIGELTALTFAGVFSFERAVRLAQLRGEAMQVASRIEHSGMLTVTYRPDTKVHEVLAKAKEHASSVGVENPICDIAGYLFPHCKVIAGHDKCLDYIKQNYRQLKLEHVRPLNIQGAQHTRLMEPAASTFKKYLIKSNLGEPVIAVHSTLDGKRYRDKSEVVYKLSKQITKPVRWEQMMHIFYERPMGHHFPFTYECGPGSTLKTILSKVNAKAFDVCECVFD